MTTTSKITATLTRMLVAVTASMLTGAGAGAALARRPLVGPVGPPGGPA